MFRDRDFVYNFRFRSVPGRQQRYACQSVLGALAPNYATSIEGYSEGRNMYKQGTIAITRPF